MQTRAIYHRRTTCRLCNSANVQCVLQLEPTPPAEWYFPLDRAHEADQRFPLDLFLCRDCGHVQLFDVIDPVRLFARYMYTSGSSPGLDDHFKEYANTVVRNLGLRQHALAVDVGSNDGTLLRHFANYGLRVFGVDPAEDIAMAATIAGIPTLNAFMDKTSARRIVAEVGKAQLVTANNVFAHNDELGEMTEAIESILADDGVFVFEVSNLLDTIKGLVFDFIYHEHLCYHSTKPMSAFLRRHGMELFDVARVASKGGSLRGYAQKIGGPRPVSTNVGNFIAKEEAAGLYDPSTYKHYIARVNSLREETLAYLQRRKAEGCVIAGYGASATVTTLLYHFQIGELLDFIVDDNPIRHGTVSPGHHIPVLDPSAIYSRRPDLIVILAWRFGKQIIDKHREYLAAGGEFVVPLTSFEVIRGESVEG